MFSNTFVLGWLQTEVWRVNCNVENSIFTPSTLFPGMVTLHLSVACYVLVPKKKVYTGMQFLFFWSKHKEGVMVC